MVYSSTAEPANIWQKIQYGRHSCREATPSGNRTRVSPVAGAYSTTRPTVSEAVSPPFVRYKMWIFEVYIHLHLQVLQH